MHPVHNCHHIKSCHPPVKQYIMMHHNTAFVIYTCSLFFICNTKVSRPRATLWNDFLNFVNILYTGLCPPRETPLKFSSLPCSPSPLLPRFLAQSLPPLASSLPSFPRAVHASFRPFINPPSLNPRFLH